MRADESLDSEFEPEGFDPEDLEPRPLRLPDKRRVASVMLVAIGLLLAVFIPPLINMNHFRKQTAASISASLGRPVHMDAMTLDILPVPGFTLTNFVVDDDPAFGSEPVIFARTVKARLRVSSLWRQRVEFSRISLNETSVNLVHRADGRWNVESILLQASRIPVAPTEQAKAGDAPRFPYIEATAARLNVKMGMEKMPISLTDAEFALWLPKPEQWRLRLEGHPARTDAAASDTGVFRLNGTLGKAAALKDVPVELTAEWSAAPLGAVSTILLGRDAEVRGEMSAGWSVTGSVGQSAMTSRLHLSNMRRAEFVPARTLDVDVVCKAEEREMFHRLQQVECDWPQEGGTVSATGEMADVLVPGAADGVIVVKGAPVEGLLDAVRAGSQRIAPELKVGGTISGEVMCCREIQGTLAIDKARVAVGDRKAFVEDEMIGGSVEGGMAKMGPLAIKLGGVTPALVEMQIGRAGLTMKLSGMVVRSTLMELAGAVPPLGDGLEEMLPETAEGAAQTPVRVDLTGTRTWTTGMVWAAAVEKKAPVKRQRRR